MIHYAVADPDLLIRGVGGGGRQSFRPQDKREGGSLKKIFFWPFGPQFGLKIRGRPGVPGPYPGSATAIVEACSLKKLSDRTRSNRSLRECVRYAC